MASRCLSPRPARDGSPGAGLTGAVLPGPAGAAAAGLGVPALIPGVGEAAHAGAAGAVGGDAGLGRAPAPPRPPHALPPRRSEEEMISWMQVRPLRGLCIWVTWPCVLGPQGPPGLRAVALGCRVGGHGEATAPLPTRCPCAQACQAAVDHLERRTETFKAAVQGPEGDAQEQEVREAGFAPVGAPRASAEGGAQVGAGHRLRQRPPRPRSCSPRSWASGPRSGCATRW